MRNRGMTKQTKQPEQKHFWFSAKQLEASKITTFIGGKEHTINRALINGKEYKYTECSSNNGPRGWDDAVYLGKGIISRQGSIVQPLAIPALKAAGIDYLVYTYE